MLLFFYYAGAPRDLRPFPTRRSSDLHAEAAGVLGQRLGDAELGREVGDRAQRAVPSVLEPARRLEVAEQAAVDLVHERSEGDRKSTRLNSSHGYISYAVFCLKKKKKN